MKHPVRYRVEYAAALLFGAVQRILPYRVSLVLAWPLARLAYGLLAKKRREAKRRLRFLLGEGADRREIDRLAWMSFRNLCFTFVEMFRIPRMMKHPERYFTPRSFDFVERLRGMVSAGGVALALPHCGNWALAGATLQALGLRVASVEARQSNPLVGGLIHRLQTGSGLRSVERGATAGGSFRFLVEALQGGSVAAFLTDVRSRKPGVLVSYFGGTANVHSGIGRIALRAGASIVPVIVRRVGWFRFDIEGFDAIVPDASAPRAEEEVRLVRAVASVLDAAIRVQPGQWFWYNSRWLLDPL